MTNSSDCFEPDDQHSFFDELLTSSNEELLPSADVITGSIGNPDYPYLYNPGTEPSAPRVYPHNFERYSWGSGETITLRPPAIHTGGDIGEVLTRTVRDCDFDRSVPRVRFKRTKTRTPQRLVPYPEMFVPELQAHIRSNGLGPNDLLFGMLKRSRIDAAHQKARKLIGQPELRIKDFRHVAAIMWRRAGVDLDSIRQWLGHATINQTVIYSNFAPDDEYDGPKVNRAAELLSGPSRILPFPSQLAG